MARMRYISGGFSSASARHDAQPEHAPEGSVAVNNPHGLREGVCNKEGRSSRGLN